MCPMFQALMEAAQMFQFSPKPYEVRSLFIFSGLRDLVKVMAQLQKTARGLELQTLSIASCLYLKFLLAFFM